MLFKEAVSQRILDLCESNHITPNKLAELSAIAPSTLQDMVSSRVANPSSYTIYQICRTLKITLKDFYDSKVFDFNKLED